MDRYVHHQLRAVVSILAAGAVAATAAGVVRGFSPPKAEGLRFAAILFALLLVSTLLKATRIKGFSDVRHFEAAVPLDDTAVVLPTDGFLRDQPFSRKLFVLYLMLTLPVSVFWEPWIVLLPLGSALDWLGQAAVAVHWERRHGRTVWRGHVGSRPWELSVSSRPPTRTATGAQPA
ncbi:hypothetical protein [Streptomyces sp. NPDC093591]|uniref:hypothetical protein n=1 Tax=Streptomyces sp. NPDC093591 TaxID=3366044 RepID=UPI0038004134